MEWYAVRYRGTDEFGRPALIVEDAAGVAFLVAAGALRQREAGPDAGARLARRLGGRCVWELITDGSRAPLGGVQCRLDSNGH